VFAVVLTGLPGAGKSSVLTALTDALSDEQWSRHVQAVCALHREAGHELLLVAQTLETDEDTNQLKRAVSADESLLVRLEARPATLVERIIDRKPESWSGLTQLVAHAQQLAASMPALRDIDLVLDTEHQRPEALAQLVRDAHPGRLRTPPLARYGMGAGPRGVSSYYDNQIGATARSRLMRPNYRLPLHNFGNVPRSWNDRATYVQLLP
jgi:RNase adaptor protein for sRNA GlmZ degradation